MVVADVIRFAIPILKSSAQCPTVSTLCMVKPTKIKINKNTNKRIKKINNKEYKIVVLRV